LGVAERITRGEKTKAKKPTLREKWGRAGKVDKYAKIAVTSWGDGCDSAILVGGRNERPKNRNIANLTSFF
jgi:hypothetical protein